MYMSKSPLIVGFLKFPILFFSMFAWCPTTPIPIINLSPLLFHKFGSTLSLTSFQTWGNDCSDYETSKFHLDSFYSLLMIRIGEMFHLSVWGSSGCCLYAGVWEECFSEASRAWMTLDLYCYLWELMISLMMSSFWVSSSFFKSFNAFGDNLVC